METRMHERGMRCPSLVSEGSEKTLPECIPRLRAYALTRRVSIQRTTVSQL